jgi:hypothetical protein
LTYWAIALGLISATAFDRTTSAVTRRSIDVAPLAWIVAIGGLVATMGLVAMLREWEQVGAVRTTSRSLVLFTFLLGAVAVVLFYARGLGVHIEACRTVSGLETCRGQASARQILGMLAWHAANVVPGLDIPDSLEWQRPARSANPVVGVSILIIRLWVVIGILSVLKHLWDKWQPGGSSPTRRQTGGEV